MIPRSAIKTDLFADDHRRKKIDFLGDSLAEIESYIDFAALAAEVDRIAPRPVGPQGSRPPYPTETMVRILVLKRLVYLQKSGVEAFPTPEMGRIAAARGDSRQNRGEMAGNGDDLPQILSRIRS